MLTAVSIPFTRRHEYVREFKQAHRRDDDIAIVNAGMRACMRRTLAGAPTNAVLCSDIGSRVMCWIVLSQTGAMLWPAIRHLHIRSCHDM